VVVPVHKAEVFENTIPTAKKITVTVVNLLALFKEIIAALF
jgi:hypothetical protein